MRSRLAIATALVPAAFGSATAHAQQPPAELAGTAMAEPLSKAAGTTAA